MDDSKDLNIFAPLATQHNLDPLTSGALKDAPMKGGNVFGKLAEKHDAGTAPKAAEFQKKSDAASKEAEDAYRTAVDTYKQQALGSTERGPLDDLLRHAETPSGSAYVKELVDGIEKNADGTITVYRAGERKGMMSVTRSKGIADVIAKERVGQGLSGGVTELRVRPEDVRAVVPGFEHELIVENAKELGKAADFAASPLGMTENTIKAIPGSVVDMGVDFLRATPRAGATLGLELTGKGEYKPTTTTDKFLYGDQPIKNLPGTGEKTLTDFGLDTASAKKYGMPVGIALTGMDLVPIVGGPEKAAGKAAVEDVSALAKSERILKEGQQLIKDDARRSTIRKIIDKTLTEYYDAGHSVNKFMKDAEMKLGRSLNIEENAYVAMRLYKGVGGKIESKLNEFGDILKTIPDHVKSGDFSNLLFIQRSIERAGRGFGNPGGLTGEEAQTALKELEQKAGPEGFAKMTEAAQAVQKYSNGLLQMAQEGGVISEQAMKDILAHNQNYTPFDIIEHMADLAEKPGGIPSGTKAFSVAEQNIVKGLKGASEDMRIDDPLNAFVRKTMKVVDFVERNKVAQKIAEVGKQVADGSILPLRTAENVTRRSEIFTQLKGLREKLVPNLRELRSTNKFSRGLDTELHSIERAAGKMHDRLAKKLGDFLSAGAVAAKDSLVYRSLKTIPLELQPFESTVKGMAKSDFLNSQVLEKEFEDGTLEKWGFKSREKFWDAVQKPLTKVAVKNPFKVIEADLKGMKQLEKRLARLGEKKEFTDVARTSVKDASNNVKRIIEDINAERKALRDEAKSLKDKPVPKDYEKISFFTNGIREEIAVPKDVGAALKNLTAKQTDFVTRGARFWASALRAGATSWNTLFIIPNAMRDFETATLVNKEGFNALDWSKGFFQAVKGELGHFGFNVDDEVFQNYLKDAGQIGGYYSTYIHEVPKTVADLTKSDYRKMAELLVNPFKWIESAGSIIERAPRLGLYMKTLSKGGGRTEAAFASREGTVDFAKMGHTGKIINMWIPFINARLQGEINVMKAIGRDVRDPNRAAWLGAKIGGMAIMPFVASYLNNTMRFPQVWDDIASYEKANNIILIYGDHKNEQNQYDQIVKIPKGDWNYFIDPIEDVMNWMRDKQTGLLNQLGQDFLFDLLPVSTSPQGSIGKTAEQGAGNLLPPPVKAGVESITNYNMFRMQPIVPASMADRTPALQYRAYTPKLAQMLGSVLGVSPLKIANAAETMFGGLGRQAMNIGGTVENPGLNLGAFNPSPRFNIAGSGGTGANVQDDINRFKTMQADRTFMDDQAAQNAYKSIMNAGSPAEAQKIIDDLEKNPSAVKALKTMIENQAKGMTAQDQELKRMSPIERSQYFMERVNQFDNAEDAQKFIADFKAKGLLTPAVIEQIQLLNTQSQ